MTQWNREVEEAIEAGARAAWPIVAATFMQRSLLPVVAPSNPTVFPHDSAGQVE
jgi:hypothetical protein